MDAKNLKVKISANVSEFTLLAEDVVQKAKELEIAIEKLNACEIKVEIGTVVGATPEEVKITASKESLITKEQKLLVVSSLVKAIESTTRTQFATPGLAEVANALVNFVKEVENI